jgi:hypothetical protein
MKKIILASVVAVAAVSSMNAYATTASVCTGAAGNGASITYDTAGTSTFVRATFTPKCSANVFLVGDDMTSYYRVGAASSKGKQAFGGSTTGGGITGTNCSTSGAACVSSDAISAATNAASS